MAEGWHWPGGPRAPAPAVTAATVARAGEVHGGRGRRRAGPASQAGANVRARGGRPCTVGRSPSWRRCGRKAGRPGAPARALPARGTRRPMRRSQQTPLAGAAAGAGGEGEPAPPAEPGRPTAPAPAPGPRGGEYQGPAGRTERRGEPRTAAPPARGGHAATPNHGTGPDATRGPGATEGGKTGTETDQPPPATGRTATERPSRAAHGRANAAAEPCEAKTGRQANPPAATEDGPQSHAATGAGPVAAEVTTADQNGRGVNWDTMLDLQPAGPRGATTVGVPQETGGRTPRRKPGSEGSGGEAGTGKARESRRKRSQGEPPRAKSPTGLPDRRRAPAATPAGAQPGPECAGTQVAGVGAPAALCPCTCGPAARPRRWARRWRRGIADGGGPVGLARGGARRSDRRPTAARARPPERP